MIRAIAIGLALAMAAAPAAAETIEIGGVTRSYITQFPDTRPAPLVIALIQGWASRRRNPPSWSQQAGARTH